MLYEDEIDPASLIDTKTELAGIDWPTALTLALTLATALFAVTGLVLVFGGVYAFINFRRIAQEQAEKTADEAAKVVAERVANQYIQENISAIMQEYVTLMQGASESQADQIAGQQDPPPETGSPDEDLPPTAETPPE